MRERVIQVREIQCERFGKEVKVRCDARVSPKQIKTHFQLGEAGEGVMQMALAELNLKCPRLRLHPEGLTDECGLAANEQV
ncbi:magnesium chelatase subunit ChlI family protein [Verrucomicrobiota bacterium sgz303538]